MKITKLQRHYFYMLLLAEAESPMCINGYECIPSTSNGFCYMLSRAFGIEAYCPRSFKALLPELFAKRYHPERGGYYWQAWSQRIEALKQCINETEPS